MLTKDELTDLLEMHECILADGFDECVVGIVYGLNKEPVALYDREKMIELMVTRDGMTYEDAAEYFGFNIEGAWVGEKTPAYADLLAPVV